MIESLNKPLMRAALERLGPTVIMEPVLGPARWTGALLRADAMAVLGQLPARSVDLIFADPPYNLSQGGTSCQGGERVPVDKGAWDSWPTLADYYRWTRGWLQLCRRLLKPSGSLWITGTMHSIFAAGWALQQDQWNILNLVTWFKPNATPNLGCRQFTHSAEQAIWAAPAVMDPLQHTFDYGDMKAVNDGKQMRDVWIISSTPAREKAFGKHPTQKPLELMTRIIDATSRPGDLVLDPFMGSGTTGVAARAQGRGFIGIERDPGFFDLAMRRLEDPLVAPLRSGTKP